MKAKRPYQLHLSRGDSVLKDVEGRTQKFRKILSILKDVRPNLGPAACLDLGCSSGIMTSLLGEECRMAIGLDIDQEAVRYAKAHHDSSRVHFLAADAMSLPFEENSIDIIVCNHVYEHVPEATRLMEEIYRILKKGGLCYFSAGNRYMIVEGHYGLPFLSWLPNTLGHVYLRWAGKGSFYYEKHLSLRKLRGLVRKFHVQDYTLRVIQDPERFSAHDLLRPHSLFHRWARWMAPYVYPWIPTYLWVLTKK
jgi:ubiquinone/menaquinone biosynthesis C-methylase UbiE